MIPITPIRFRNVFVFEPCDPRKGRGGTKNARHIGGLKYFQPKGVYHHQIKNFGILVPLY